MELLENKNKNNSLTVSFFLFFELFCMLVDWLWWNS